MRESSLKDNMAFTNSVFEQNKEVFGPLSDKVFNQLMQASETRHNLMRYKGKCTNTVNPNKAQAWFDKERELLKGIIGATALSFGIPQRAFQMVKLRYRSSEVGKRNLFICKSNVVIGFPASKLYSRTIQESLWALPPGLSKNFLLYLGVIRPVSLRLADALRWKRSPLSKTNIFAPVPSKQEGRVDRVDRNGSKINAILQSQTLPALKISLSLSQLRQLIISIFRTHLNDLIDEVDPARTSIVHLAADHHQITGNNYGQNAGSLTGLFMSDTKIDQFIEVSHAWQALLGIRPPDKKMQERMYKIPAVHLQGENLMNAMERARSLVGWEYGVVPDSNKKKLAEAFDKKPFFPRPNTEELGDKVLIGVVSKLIYGHGRPGVKEAAPVNGYSVDTILEASALIERRLMECEIRMEFDPRTLSVKTWIENYKRENYGYMVALSTKREQEWIDLGRRIFLSVIRVE